MLTTATPESASQTNLQRAAQQTGDGIQRALAGSPVQMLLMLQRTAGNQAVNQLLRQYKNSRQPKVSPVMPVVQRCGGKTCNCSPQEKAAHAGVQLLEEQTPTTSAGPSASIQRDSDDDDGAGDDNPAPAGQDSTAVSAPDPNANSNPNPAPAAEPSAGEDQTAQAADTTADSDAAQTDDTNTDAAPNDAAGGDQSAAGTDQDGDGQTDAAGDGDDTDAPAGPVEPVPSIAGEGDPIDEVAHGGNVVDLSGLTSAHFMNSRDPGNFTTTAGDGCGAACAAGDCVHVVGTMTSTFTITTNVSLPTIQSNYTDSEKKITQYAIDNCIAPHEQQHVAAYNAYNGTVQTPFDITCCRAVVQASIKAVHDQVAKARHDTVQASSDALDPFPAKVDLDGDADDPASCMTCPPSKV